LSNTECKTITTVDNTKIPQITAYLKFVFQ